MIYQISYFLYYFDFFNYYLLQPESTPFSWVFYFVILFTFERFRSHCSASCLEATVPIGPSWRSVTRYLTKTWILGNGWHMMNVRLNAMNIMGYLLCFKTSALWWEEFKIQRRKNRFIRLKIYRAFLVFIFKPIMILISLFGFLVLVSEDHGTGHLELSARKCQ